MNYQRFLLNVVAGMFLLPAFLDTHAEGGNSKRATFVKPGSVLTLHAELDGAAALPVNSDGATGDVVATYDPSTHVLKFHAYFVGLSGPATNARFHGPAAIDRPAGATVAAPRPEARLVEGTAWLDHEQEQDLLEERWYFNVTTEKHPDGEIRGMLRLQSPGPQ